MLKQIASTDPLSAEKKFRDPFVFMPTHSLILYTNYLPKIGSDDLGTWRRLVPVPFNARIEKPEFDLAERLLNEAGGAILQWCIEGAMMFIENGYRLPESVAVNSAKEQYKAENDWLTQFLEECCEYGANKVEKASLLYERYANWCMSTGEYKRCNRDFSRALEARGVPKKRANRGNYWYGVAICDNPD
jgi:P4 family phage/plasmid primase-like protien